MNQHYNTIKNFFIVPINLMPGEKRLHERSASYRIPNGKKMDGKMIITNMRVIYDVPFDMNMRGQVAELSFIRWGTIGYMELERQSILEIKGRKNIKGTSITIIMKDGTKHLFDMGWWRSRKIIRSLWEN